MILFLVFTKLYFVPDVLYCAGNSQCVIARDAKFHSYDSENNISTASNYCAKCFLAAPDPVVLDGNKYV